MFVVDSSRSSLRLQPARSTHAELVPRFRRGVGGGDDRCRAESSPTYASRFSPRQIPCRSRPLSFILSTTPWPAVAQLPRTVLYTAGLRGACHDQAWESGCAGRTRRPLTPSRWMSGVLGAFLAAMHFLHAPLHVVLLFAELESQSPILDYHLEAWHRGCDAHVGAPVETPAARDCARALHELAVYAEMKGFSSRAEGLTAFAKQIGWSRE